jgi:hypothetical protein
VPIDLMSWIYSENEINISNAFSLFDPITEITVGILTLPKD